LFAESQPGRSPTVLALHGWGRDRHDLLDALEGLDTIAPDLPGFGASPAPPAAWGAREYAERVAEFIRESNGGPYLVVGHSFGGRIAACLAADHRDLVVGVVFIGVPLLRATPTSKSPLRYRLVRAARRMGLLSERRLEAARQRYGSQDYRNARGVMRDVLVRLVNEDYRDELARISCPVGLLWGSHDTAAPPAIARRAQSLLAHVAAIEIVEGAGHDVHRDSPDDVCRVIAAVAEAAA
jgi:pimeloyl-ACP methyl ester carboxylesterase